MRAAEELLGTFGIEAVSMRQIMIAANVSNKSAIAYHFGNRDELIRQILQWRLPVLEPIRREMLDAVRAQGLEHDPHHLAHVLLLPACRLVDADGKHRYMAFLRQLLRFEHGLRLRNTEMALSPTSSAAYQLFRECFPHLSADQCRWRVQAATGLFFDLVYDRDRSPLDHGIGTLPEEEFLDEAIRMMVACCAV
ncbi:TetR family transcriptional regulator [Sphingobium sp. AEW010]|nr:TetR family transcriptional regulator [Sphingobium sp. AEW010]TWD17798.1 TetR family transcriptional regulator [Sphingobium sp. AEW013]TWD20042.1 TetR family transcriptional regulator [Sphingobium sp. AEW001]